MKLPPSSLENTESSRTLLENQLEFVVRQSYEDIYELDLDRGLCHILYSGESGDFQTRNLLEALTEEAQRVHSEDAPMFRELFSPASMLRRFSAGERDIAAEYRRRGQNGAYRWFHLRITPIPLPETLEPTRLLALFQDIDHRKRAEEAARRLQTKYFLALRTSCGHICDVNPVTGQYRLSITGDSLLEQAPEEGDFNQYINWMAANVIHPEDAAAWLNAMLLEKLQAAFTAGRRQVSIDYRYGNPARGWQWRCNTAVWLSGETREEASILVFARDISEQKKAEQLESHNRMLLQEISHQKKISLRADRYRIIVEQTGAGVYEWIHNPDMPPALIGVGHREILRTGRFYNSPRILREFHIADENCDFLQTLSLRGDIHPEDLERFNAFRLQTDCDQTRNVLCRVLTSGGELWYKFTLMTMTDGDHIERIVGTSLNVDMETRANRALELSNIRYRTVLQQTDTIEFEYDMTTGQRYISPLLWERYDAAEQTQTCDFTDYLRVFPADMENVRQRMEQFRRERPPRCELRCRVRDKAGNFVWCRIILDTLRDESGRVTRLLGTIHNVDSETRAYEALREKAEHDGLTGIWNQGTFFAAVNRMLEQETLDRNMAMIMMDIDKFKVINEIFGMEGGNRALILVGKLLRRLLGLNGYYARMYADVFCLAAPYETVQDLERLMTQIIDGLSCRDFDYMLTPCFGVCPIRGTNISSTELVEMAGYAHKAVKSAAGKHWAFYDETMRSSVIEQKQIESEMEQALQSGQFQIYLQPKYRLPGRTVEGAEALVRWIHPQKGLIPPGKFIPLFEENGFITQLDAYVWEETCKLIRRWIDQGKTPLPVSVNVSRMHIYNQDLREILSRLVEKYNIPKGYLELELTESMFPDNMQSLLSMLRELQDAGFVLAMDDFGSGYSSLNMLKDMPLNVLKIDCEFFGETEEEKRGRTVVRHTVAMAHELQMRVVAEGVETESEADFLSETGCDTAQGFYFARPIPISEFDRLAFPEKASK